MSYRYPTANPGSAALVFGVGLPALAILIELLTGWCAGTFFDPLPTFGHLLLVLVVPVVNVMLWMTARDEVAGPRWLAVATGVSLAIAGTYTLLLLPILPIATLAIVVLGIGLLPFAPLIATILSASWAMAIEWSGRGGWLVAAGVVAGLVAVTIADMPATAVHLAINRYDGSDADRAGAVRLMRRVGDRRMLLRIAHGDSARATGLVSAFASAWSGRIWSGETTRSDDARELYYRVTGEPYNARPKPAGGLAARRNWFVSDPDLGGERVGARVPGLSLATSRIDGSVAAADNLAYVEWTVEIANAAAIQNEARFTLAMPEGAVASRATLWVDGVPREASVAGRAEVRAAYQKVVHVRRDPLLVTTDGAGRLLVQAFPIAPGGTMRLRVGYTAPFAIAADGRRSQALPAIVERNFEIATDLKDNVWIDGDAALTSGDAALHTAGNAVRGGVIDADLITSRPTFSAPRLTVPMVRVGTVAADAKQPALAVEQRISPARDDAKSLTILLDGSAPMARAGATLFAALDALPAGLPVGLVIAADDPVVIAPRPWSSAQRTAIAKAIGNVSYNGGQDDLPQLAEAIAQASLPGGRVLWVHGAQPVEFARSTAALEQVLARATTLPTLIRYQAEPGRAFTITGEPLFETARMVAPSGDVAGDLRAILAGLSGPQWRTTYRPVVGATGSSAHIVRLWAAHDLAGQGRAAGKTRDEAIALARRLNLITPVSGAVVLETDKDYRANDLPVPSADDVPTIPEPETWALLAILAACAMWLLRRRIHWPQARFRMMPARTAMIVVSAACWDGWRLLAGRIDDASAALLVAAMIGVIGWRFVVIGDARIAPLPVAAMLAVYAVTCLTGPALLQIVAAVGVLMLVAFRGARVPRLPVAGLAALMLPVLPTLDFLLAYPLRRVSAAITVALLRLNGVEVTLNGIALEWQGQSLLFDGPCSGVRMLWAALVLASLVALVGRHGPLAYARLLAVATGIAVAGNALRAASLFYVENDYIALLHGPVAHEAIGLVAFVLVAVAVIAAPRLRWRAA